ncbi:MAG: hypothetical protein AAFY71_26630 [Bacteroidota bacterium]
MKFQCPHVSTYVNSAGNVVVKVLLPLSQEYQSINEQVDSSSGRITITIDNPGNQIVNTESFGPHEMDPGVRDVTVTVIDQTVGSDVGETTLVDSAFYSGPQFEDELSPYIYTVQTNAGPFEIHVLLDISEDFSNVLPNNGLNVNGTDYILEIHEVAENRNGMPLHGFLVEDDPAQVPGALTFEVNDRTNGRRRRPRRRRKVHADQR